jgi:uncharacterized protein YegP (UPF0339 family)
MEFQLRKAKDGEYYFTLRARNYEVIATSEMYKTKQACKKGIASVRRNALFAKVTDFTY